MKCPVYLSIYLHEKGGRGGNRKSRAYQQRISLSFEILGCFFFFSPLSFPVLTFTLLGFVLFCLFRGGPRAPFWLVEFGYVDRWRRTIVGHIYPSPCPPFFGVITRPVFPSQLSEQPSQLKTGLNYVGGWFVTLVPALRCGVVFVFFPRWGEKVWGRGCINCLLFIFSAGPNLISIIDLPF